MAHTARKKDEKKEFFDPPDVLEKKVEQLAQWIRESKHMIAFTVSSVVSTSHINDNYFYYFYREQVLAQQLEVSGLLLIKKL